MKITQRCSCGATFEIEGPEVPVGFRVTEWLDAHAACRSPPAAAPGAGPDFWALATEHGDEAEAGPKPEKECPDCGVLLPTIKGVRGHHTFCQVAARLAEQPSPAQPEGEK